MVLVVDHHSCESFASNAVRNVFENGFNIWKCIIRISV